MNALPYLGVKIQRASGEPLRLVGGEVTQSQVRLVQTVVVPSRKAKFVEARLDVPLIEGEALIFEPDVESLTRCGLVAPEALVTLKSDSSVLVPVENYETLPSRMDSDLKLGQVVRPNKEVEPVPLYPEEEELSASQSLQVEVSQASTVGERKQKLIKVLGLTPEVEGLPVEQFEQLKKLLEDNHDVFAVEEGELGCTGIVQHVIDTGDHPPIKQLMRRMQFVHREKVSSMVDEMLEQGIIQPSVSPWSSPIVLVPKKDGSYRFCVDYRRLNGVSRKDVYPLPRIDDILDTLGETRYFSSLDLCSGYWQIELHPESRPKSVFVTHRGLHEFVRLPFGLCNGPSTFQRLMEVVLSGLVWSSCFVYIDDVLVCSRTFEEHLQHLSQVFERLRQANLKLKPKKCLFLREEVPYLGHVVTREGIHPDPSKTAKIREYPVPKDVSQLRQFLGLASYYRRFICGFSKIAAPLHALLRKDVCFQWDDSCQQAFTQLKECLVSAPVLVYPQFKADVPFVLETNASVHGLSLIHI